jgi:serine protease Do
LRIRDDILFSGMLTYGWIGFEVEVVSSIEKGRQILLNHIFPDTPAQEVGLMEGDVLLQIGEYPIESLDQLRNAMFYTRVGQYVDVQVLRDGEIRLFSVRTVPRPADEPMEIRANEPDPEPINPIKEEPEEEPEGTIPFEEDIESVDSRQSTVDG